MEQIITEEGHLVENLEEHIDRIGIPEAGLDYHMISIIGCQSSGKSTLLNLLFGTSFETMDEKRGRQQTTKGIHASIAIDNPLLIFDVEGCDSRERGDADALFERKAALFALSLSEIMIVNMWESDIGRWNAANLPMLRTVFEVNVQLFQARVDSKTTLLFLIRDYTNDNFDALTQNICRDMANVWKDISLPPEYQGREISDFFDFKFFAIHHMKIQRDIFDADVNTLKLWFTDKEYKDYLFKDASSKNVPGDGLAQYIASLWNVIYDNKELNIPSQRSMLSYYKCEENMKAAVSDLIESLSEKLNAPLKRKEIIYDFRDICEPPVSRAFSAYKDNSWRYMSDVVEEKYNDMKTQIHEFLFPMFTKNASLFADQTSTEFFAYVDLQGDELVPNGHWFDDNNSQLEKNVNEMKKQIQAMMVPPYNEWSFDFPSFEESMTAYLNGRKASLIDFLHSTVCSSVLHSFNEEANEILKDSSDVMWIKLRELMNNKIEIARKQIQSILDTNTPNETAKDYITKNFEDEALMLVKESAKYVLLKMKTAFDKNFKYENGRPRVWTKDADVNQIFEDSKKAGENVLRLFTFCRLRDPNVKVQNDRLNQILIGNDTSEETLETYHRIIKHTYEEAKGVIKAQMAQDQIPAGAWVLLFFLGGDKIMKLMANPLVFTFALFFGGGYFMLNQLGLWDVAVEAAKDRFYSILDNLQGGGGGDEDDDDDEENESENDSQQQKKQQGNDKKNISINNDSSNINSEQLQDDDDAVLDLSKPIDSIVNPEVPPLNEDDDEKKKEMESSGIDANDINLFPEFSDDKIAEELSQTHSGVKKEKLTFNEPEMPTTTRKKKKKSIPSNKAQTLRPS